MLSLLDIDPPTLEAGPETDALVAEAVMELLVIPDCDGFRGPFEATPKKDERYSKGLWGRPDFTGRKIQSYSSSISPAFEVVEKIKSTTVDGLQMAWVTINNQWEVCWQVEVDGTWAEWVYANTLPLAISRAALEIKKGQMLEAEKKAG